MMLEGSVVQEAHCFGLFGLLGSTSEVVAKSVERLTNPPDIVTFTESGFGIDMNNMARNIPYIIEFEDNRYVMWKNDMGELVVWEVC